MVAREPSHSQWLASDRNRGEALAWCMYLHHAARERRHDPPDKADAERAPGRRERDGRGPREVSMNRTLWSKRARQAGLAALGGALFWGLATLNAALVAVSSAVIAARGLLRARAA